MGETSDRWTVNLDGATLQDRFQVERMIGGGGMANVYRARDTQLEIPVVVKIPHAVFLAEPGFRERFDRETRDLVTLQHPHIVRVLARGEHDGLPFLVMQFLQGGSFGDRLRAREGEPLPFSEVRPWVRDVARALDFIHGQGIVHRDIKPDNVLFDEHGHAYLSDFGIAKAVGGVDTGLTVTGATPGSPAYMAPEQPRTSSLTGASDQYSLAATLYEALSGRPTFEGETVVDVLIRKQSELPAPLHEIAPDVPRPAADALMRALAKDPEDRFPTCEAMVDAMLAPPAATAAPVLQAAAVVARGAQVSAAPRPAGRPGPGPAPASRPAAPPAAAPARTESVGSTSTFSGGTKALWIVFAVLLLGGPAAMLMVGEDGPQPASSTDVADQGVPIEEGGDAWDPPSISVTQELPPAVLHTRILGSWVVDEQAIRERLKEAEKDARVARMVKRHRRELELAIRQQRELELRADGTFRMTLPNPDGRGPESMAGTWRYERGAVQLEPDPESLPKGLKREPEPFSAELVEDRLLLRRPGPGPGVPLRRRP